MPFCALSSTDYSVHENTSVHACLHSAVQVIVTVWDHRPSCPDMATSVIRPPRTAVPDGLMFYPRCFFSPRFLQDPSTDRPETLPRDRNLAEFYKLTSKIRGLYPQKIWDQKHAKFRSILDHFRLWSRISPERLKISKIGRRYKLWQFLLRLTKKVRWTLVH